MSVDHVFHHALKFQQQGDLANAGRLYEEVLNSEPNHFDALHMLGIVRFYQGAAGEGVRLINKALTIRPESPQVYYNLGWLMQERRHLEDAIVAYQNALKIDGSLVDAHNNLGNVFRELNRIDEAVACFKRALAIDPDYSNPWLNLACIFRERGKFDEAIECYRKILIITPGDPATLNSLGVLYQETHRLDDAIACFQKAIAIHPDFTDALYNLGSAFQDRKELNEAMICYRKVLALDRVHEHASGQLIRLEMRLCDWTETEKLTRNIRENIADGHSFDPFIFLGMSGDPALQLQCSRNYIKHEIPALPVPLRQFRSYDHQKIRIAYVSADFYEHATSYLMAELFELHDRKAFEIIGVSFGPDDQSEMRRRVAGAFDRFIDVRRQTDFEAAKLIYDLEVDIAVDLKGYTNDARPGILAHRPAPVQINYLGYPGTMGAEFIDYIIGDPIVTPFFHQHFYTEKIIQLPGCYQVNDSKRAIAPETPSRKDCGLPQDGFVFCCFNKNAKILPEVFDVWMRLLRNVENSVLWLFEGGAGTVDNLRTAAIAHGVSPHRLIFASRMKLAQHLARHRVADLFLDTHPYNAHTTASDALWAGLPLVTYTGTAFAGRVASSLLRASGMPELVASGLEEYEALALKLATNRQLLAGVREKLSRNIRGSALFDTDRFRKDIEAAYRIVCEKCRRNESPSSFAVGG